MLDNKGKAELLGMPFGTASSKLRKMLLFTLVEELGRLQCYRCGENIDSIEEFSIEHKKAWAQAENPIESFFDLNNIAFSHLCCNSGAALKIGKIYVNAQERRAVQFKRYYSRNSEQVLLRKRERYHQNK